ncbi:MAG TPA: holo-[acyl-carrier-protein] synthase [Solibacterales bacterium]|nr:holo-[acyl-carrier-protein] synthase [Bryobacterales bacterium]
MIVGTGLDVARVDRIQAAATRFGKRFLERVFTPREMAYADSKANRFERYAARFAAKEAGMKAIGTGWRRGVRWHDFEVVNLKTGRPTLQLHGRARAVADELGVANIWLSLTHTEEFAMAQVILET